MELDSDNALFLEPDALEDEVSPPSQLAPKLLPGAAVAFNDLVFDVEFEFERERYRMLVRSASKGS